MFTESFTINHFKKKVLYKFVSDSSYSDLLIHFSQQIDFCVRLVVVKIRRFIFIQFNKAKGMNICEKR